MAISKIKSAGITADFADTLTAADLAPNSVDSSELVDGSVDLSHMSVNSVDSDQYVDGSIYNAHLADDAVGTDELANDVTISTSGNIATTGSGTLTVAGDTTHNGNVIMATNKKVLQKGAAMISSTHQALILK